MKKLCICIDIIIILFIVVQYVLFFYKDSYNEISVSRIESAVEQGDMQYIRRQFDKEAQVKVIKEENEFIYYAEYALNCLEESLPLDIEKIEYIENNDEYKIVYTDSENVIRTVYIRLITEQVNLFQIKITAMQVRFV